MPASDAYGWEAPTMDAVQESMAQILPALASNNERRDKTLAKYDPAGSLTQSYVVGQFQNDPVTRRTSITELVKHPRALFVQFQGAALASTHVWRWVAGDADSVNATRKAALWPEWQAEQESPPQSALFAYYQGHLQKLSDAEKLDALKGLDGRVCLIPVAHGISMFRGGIAPEQTFGHLTPDELAARITESWLAVASGRIDALYTRLFACSIVLPQEQVFDSNSFVGLFLQAMRHRNPALPSLRASASRFNLSNQLSGIVMRPHSARHSMAATSQELSDLGWGRKLNAYHDGGVLTAALPQLTVTRLEADLIEHCRRPGAPKDILVWLGSIQHLLEESWFIGPSSKMDSRWEDLRILVNMLGLPGNALSWESAGAILIFGESQDFLELEFADKTVSVKNLRRNLFLFKDKLLHFPLAVQTSAVPGISEPEWAEVLSADASPVAGGSSAPNVLDFSNLFDIPASSDNDDAGIDVNSVNFDWLLNVDDEVDLLPPTDPGSVVPFGDPHGLLRAHIQQCATPLVKHLEHSLENNDWMANPDAPFSLLRKLAEGDWLGMPFNHLSEMPALQDQLRPLFDDAVAEKCSEQGWGAGSAVLRSIVVRRPDGSGVSPLEHAALRQGNDALIATLLQFDLLYTEAIGASIRALDAACPRTYSFSIRLPEQSVRQAISMVDNAIVRGRPDARQIMEMANTHRRAQVARYPSEIQSSPDFLGYDIDATPKLSTGMPMVGSKRRRSSDTDSADRTKRINAAVMASPGLAQTHAQAEPQAHAARLSRGGTTNSITAPR